MGLLMRLSLPRLRLRRVRQYRRPCRATNQNPVPPWLLQLWFLVFLRSFIPILGWLLGIGAVVCGAIGLSKIKKQLASGKGMAITGIVLGSIGFVAACGWFIYGLIAYAAGAH